MRLKRNLILSGLGVLLVLASIILVHRFYVVIPAQQRANDFEIKLKRTLDSDELRIWAFQYMSDHPHAAGEVVSNPPASIRKFNGVPRVVSFRDDEGDQRYLMLSWGRNYPAILIGRTNFNFDYTGKDVTRVAAGIYIQSASIPSP